MSARDDFPVIAAMADLLPAERAGVEAAAMFAELDALRAGRGFTVRIEALRARAREAEALVTVLYRACRPQSSVAAREAALDAYADWLRRERVA